MAVLHAALAWVAAVSIVAVLALALAVAVGWLRSYRALDAALLAQAGLALLAGAAGIGVAAVSAAPSDPLHVLYGALAAGTPLGARVAAQNRGGRAIGRWVTIAAAVALGATVRSFMTGS